MEFFQAVITPLYYGISEYILLVPIILLPFPYCDL